MYVRVHAHSMCLHYMCMCVEVRGQAALSAGAPTEPGAHWQARRVVTKLEVDTAEVSLFRIKSIFCFLKNI